MPIAQVQKAIANQANSVTITATLAAPPTDGNLLVLILLFAVKVTEPLSINGVPWTFASYATYGGTSHLYMYYKQASSDLAAITATFEDSRAAILAVAEYSGMAATDPIDRDARAEGTSDVTSLLVPLSAATRNADDLLIVALGHKGHVTAPSWSDSFTAQDDAQTGTGADQIDLQWADRIVAATGTFETTGSWTTARTSGGIIVAFKDVDVISASSRGYVMTSA